MADSEQQPQDAAAPYQDDPSQPPPSEPEQSTETPDPARSLDKHIRHLTLVSISLAVASFVIGTILTVLVVIGESEGYYMPWGFKEPAGWLIFAIILTILISATNLYQLRHGRHLRILANMLFDLIIAFTAISAGVPALDSIADRLSNRCSHWRGSEKCEPIELAMHSFAIIALSLVLILGIVHVVFLIVRAVIAYRTKVWRKSLSHGFPSGQFTVEFSLKMYRKPEPTVGRQIEDAETAAGAEAGAQPESLV